MLEDFMVRCLLMLFGYAYPAFQCYKAVVKSRIEVEELRFWCQFWIIVAILTVVERIADTFVAWLPMYGELKLALFIYLWYPKTKGSGYVFDMLLRPFVNKHETDIEQKLVNWRVKAWDLALFYWKNCTEFSQSAFLQVLNYMVSQPPGPTALQTSRNEQQGPGPNAPPPPPPNDLPSFFQKLGKQTKNKSKKWFPSAPPLLGSGNSRSTTGTEQPNVQFPVHDQTNNFVGEEWEPLSPQTHDDQKHNESRFRRSRPHH